MKNRFLLFENVKKIEFPSHKDAFCQLWLILVQCFWWLVLKFRQCIFAISSLSSLGKRSNKLESHLPKNALCKVGWKWPSTSGIIFFLNFVNVISLFRWYLHLEKGWVLPLNKLNCLYSKVLCAKFGLDWRSDSGEEDF